MEDQTEQHVAGLRMLGWLTANLFREEIVERCGSFPVLFITGLAGSGKTVAGDILSDLHCEVVQQPVIIFDEVCERYPQYERLALGIKSAWADKVRPTIVMSEESLTDLSLKECCVEVRLPGRHFNCVDSSHLLFKSEENLERIKEVLLSAKQDKLALLRHIHTELGGAEENYPKITERQQNYEAIVRGGENLFIQKQSLLQK